MLGPAKTMREVRQRAAEQARHVLGFYLQCMVEPEILAKVATQYQRIVAFNDKKEGNGMTEILAKDLLVGDLLLIDKNPDVWGTVVLKSQGFQGVTVTIESRGKLRQQNSIPSYSLVVIKEKV